MWNRGPANHGAPLPAHPLLEWVGRVFVFLGLLLILSYAAVRWASERARDADVQQFEAEVAAVETGDPVDARLDDSIEVDQRLWSPRRIGLYREMLLEDRGPPIALLRIPSVGIRVPVHDGTDEWALTRGVGRIRGTARPGEGSNIAIAGHRDGFFRALKDIEINDTLELRTVTTRETYVVRSLSIVEPTETRVLLPTENPSVTLVTCYPFYFVGKAPRRFVVLAEKLGRAPAGAAP